LLDSASQLSEANKHAIAESAERGVEIVLVTGRRYDFARPIAAQLPCPLHLIVSNGALIKSNEGETHQQLLLPAEIARHVIEETREFRALCSVVFDRPREGQMIFESINWEDPVRGRYFQRNRENIATVSPLTACLEGESPIQVMFVGRFEQIRAAKKLIDSLPRADEFTVSLTEYESRDFSILDVLRRGVNKGAALAEWARHRRIAPAEVMAIGDNWNDREMLEFAGVPIVMGNAIAELKMLGWETTLSNDQSGVAAAIRKYCGGNGRTK
ncbi:MAG: Cof-type HAD-IIB family hydrolase, partial [Candidatus Acidiferrales bacterium]